jgi:hypothetical protein
MCNTNPTVTAEGFKIYTYDKQYILKDGTIKSGTFHVRVKHIPVSKSPSKAKQILADESRNLKELAQKYDTTENYCYSVLHRRAHT